MADNVQDRSYGLIFVVTDLIPGGMSSSSWPQELHLPASVGCDEEACFAGRRQQEDGWDVGPAVPKARNRKARNRRKMTKQKKKDDVEKPLGSSADKHAAPEHKADPGGMSSSSWPQELHLPASVGSDAEACVAGRRQQ